MFSSLGFGFFDPDELRRHNLVARDPLDLQAIRQLFSELGEVRPDGSGCVDGHRFLIHPDGFIESTSVLSSRKVIDFVSRLVKETGCTIASAQFGGLLTLDSLVSNFEQLASIFAPRVSPGTNQGSDSTTDLPGNVSPTLAEKGVQ